jgi:hypothetical protein
VSYSSAAAIGFIEGAISRPGARDISRLSALGVGSLEKAARQLVDLREPLLVLTGLYLSWPDEPGPETDGPIGVAALCRVLAEAGGTGVVVTDASCAEVVQACLAASHAAPAFDVVGVALRDPQPQLFRLSRQFHGAVALSVERLGPASDGRVRTMRGSDSTDDVAPLHLLFESAGQRLAIGDGGNEIGMGRLPVSAISSVVMNGAEIACSVGCDQLIVAGTSNWGCYGLMAAMGVMKKSLRPEVLAGLAPDQDRKVLQAALDSGAIDGVTGERSLSVDGVACSGYEPLLLALGDLIQAG